MEGGEVVLGGVGVPKALVGFDDADELDVGALEDAAGGGESHAFVEEAVDMAVSEGRRRRSLPSWEPGLRRGGCNRERGGRRAESCGGW